MVERIKFQSEFREIQIKRHPSFKKLKLKAARLNKGEWGNKDPDIEMLLSNDTTQFRSYSNLVPETKQLNCFDISSTS